MSSLQVDTSTVAQALHEWFKSVFHLVGETLFCVAPEGPHREAVILDILSKNAREVRTATLDATGNLYTPVAFLLVAICKRLNLSLTTSNWHAAAENVFALRKKINDFEVEASSVGLGLGTSASIFKNLLDEALRNSGLAGVDSILNEKNKQMALGLAANWGIRFLLSYALECKENLPTSNPEQKDLSWISSLVDLLMQSSGKVETT